MVERHAKIYNWLRLQCIFLLHPAALDLPLAIVTLPKYPSQLSCARQLSCRKRAPRLTSYKLLGLNPLTWRIVPLRRKWLFISLFSKSSIGLSPRINRFITEGSLEVKLPTLWTDGKAEVGRVSEEKKRSTKIREERKSQKKEDAGAREGRKVTNHCVFPMICGSGGSKSRLAKAAGAEPAGQMRDEKNARCFWCAAHFEVKMYKADQVRTTFGS